MAAIDLQCSFCSKAQAEVQKLIAGPNVYICNECVALCQEILGTPAAKHPDTRIQQFYARAASDLEAAAALLERGFCRQALEVARNGADAALQAYLLYRDGQIPSRDFAFLLTLAVRDDPELRRLYDLRYTELVTRVSLGASIGDADARFGFEAAARIVEFVRREIGAA